ncbi:hypothetical protein HGR_08239 [Hylemonella gracilis ATCC 19624]|uniref:Uncharacterized protein n=1 Tax=Hylemonella gracilis ATCC 19624 TaxID=887062 RepID=F3KT67_9BURK|nr:hypothetical protein HGR_08239 [Hylemonella gracilis ATCC 19624]
MRSQSQELVQTVAVFKLAGGHAGVGHPGAGHAAVGRAGGAQPALLSLR